MSLSNRVRPVEDMIIRLYHWDGSGRYIELAGPNQDADGVVLLEGVAGIIHAPIELVEIKTARLPGAIPVTYRVEKRMIELATLVQGRDSIGWQYWNQNLLQMLSPVRDSLLVVQTLPWGPRWIKVRRALSPDDEVLEDPTWALHQTWNWTLAAYDPDWRGRDLMSKTFSPVGSSGAGELKAANRGDRPSWPKVSGKGGAPWKIRDGVGGVLNPLPAMAAGETWVVDTHPMAWQLQSSTDPLKWEKLQRGFREQIAPRSIANVGVEVAGASAGASATLILEQRYEWPMGYAVPDAAVAS